MAVGDLDAARLALLDRFYNPSSRAFCESAGVAEGDTVADIGCGHGSMTRWLAERVGPGRFGACRGRVRRAARDCPPRAQ